VITNPNYLKHIESEYYNYWKQIIDPDQCSFFLFVFLGGKF
jgi:hypothetical protein